MKWMMGSWNKIKFLRFHLEWDNSKHKRYNLLLQYKVLCNLGNLEHNQPKTGGNINYRCNNCNKVIHNQIYKEFKKTRIIHVQKQFKLNTINKLIQMMPSPVVKLKLNQNCLRLKVMWCGCMQERVSQIVLWTKRQRIWLAQMKLQAFQ